MERIGIAASKISKGNFLIYNLAVVVISFLFTLLIFVIAGSSVLLALAVMSFLIKGIMPLEFERNWAFVVRVCMVTLTVLAAFFNLFAISKNIRINRSKIDKS